jgi:hypothetical protein
LKKLAIIHFMPLEYYPPVTNFLDIITKHPFVVKVWSTHNVNNRAVYFNKELKNITRSVFPKKNDNILKRFTKYCIFNLSCFLDLVIYRPEVVFYYESYSVFPVFLYLKLFGKGTRLYIHYHEYEDRENYKNGMKLVRYYHELEKKFLYERASWISQTNKDRLHMFASDHPKLPSEVLKIMPNYPPKIWSSQVSVNGKIAKNAIRTVYVGSLSLKDTFIREYCNWLLVFKRRITLDIFAYNMSQETKAYLENLNAPNIRFYNDGISYDKLPNILTNYDVGLILYRGNTTNYIYNAPNKLFEYLVCGLQVWYSDTLLGMKDYESENINKIDFENIPELMEIQKSFVSMSPSKKYIAEEVYSIMLKHIIKSINKDYNISESNK